MSTKSKTTVKVPPPTAEEQDDKARARAINEGALFDQGYVLEKQDDGTYRMVERPKTPEEQEQADFDRKLQDQIRQRLLGGPVDPETQKLVGQTYESQRVRGMQNIDQYAREPAGSRGMSLSDSPIGGEALRQQGNLETGLRGAEAGSLLDVGSRNQIFAQALNEFQVGLRQQALMNRQGVGEAYMQNAMGLQRERMGSATQTSRQNNVGPMLLGGGLGILGGVGGGLAGNPRLFG